MISNYRTFSFYNLWTNPRKENELRVVNSLKEINDFGDN